MTKYRIVYARISDIYWHKDWHKQVSKAEGLKIAEAKQKAMPQYIYTVLPVEKNNG